MTDPNSSGAVRQDGRLDIQVLLMGNTLFL